MLYRYGTPRSSRCAAVNSRPVSTPLDRRVDFLRNADNEKPAGPAGGAAPRQRQLVGLGFQAVADTAKQGSARQRSAGRWNT